MRSLTSFVVAIVVASALSASTLSGCGGQSDKNASKPQNPNGGPSSEGGASDEADAGGARAEGGSHGAVGGDGSTPGGGSSPSGGANTTGGSTSTAGDSSGGSPVLGGSGGSSASSSQGGGMPVPSLGGAGNVPVEPPQDCVNVEYSQSDVVCDYTVSCNNTTHKASCYRLDADFWTCSCVRESLPGRLEIKAVDGVDACGAAAHVCADEVSLGETRCETLNDYVDEISCLVENACSTELGLDAESQAWSVDTNGAGCTRDPEFPGRFNCWCAVDSGQQTMLRVDAPATEGMCESLLDYCKQDKHPQFEGPATCREQSVTVGTDGCDMSQVCSLGAEVAGQIRLVSETHRSVQCLKPENGTSACTCSADGFFHTFTAELPAANRAGCEAAFQYCTANAEIESEGEQTCTVIAESSSARSCEMTLECTQPVVIGGTEFGGSGELSVHCEQATSAGPWSCSCSSLRDAAHFELRDIELSWEACAAAAPRCEEELEVVVGPYSASDTTL